MAEDGYRLRQAMAADAPVLAYQRRAMFESMGQVDAAGGDELETAARHYLERAIPAGTFVAWVVEHDGAIVAGAGIQLRELVPRPRYVHGEPEALVLSMWCEPDHRRRGLGTRIMEAIVAWCRERGIRRIALHASNMGRPLYERFGFTPTNEMRLEL